MREGRRRKDVKTLRLEKLAIWRKLQKRMDGIGEWVYRTRINQRLTGERTF